ncbi:hypothetical protein VUR80DRAFT_1854 [Thermomyces stellatus]
MTRKTMKRRANEDEDSGSEAGGLVSKKSKSGPTETSMPGSFEDDEGNTYWQLSKNRRVTLSEFKGATLVNIREYYQKDGKFLPGKKGISLSLAQYEDLLKAIPGINSELAKKTGQRFDNPDDANVPVAKAGRASKPKANIETTSSEEDE